MSFDWKSLIGTLAPTIATALGGPLAGLAIKTLSGAILNKEDGTEDEISIALAGAGAETLAKVREADQSFKLAMKNLDVKLEDLTIKDRASARDRQIALKDRVPEYLAYLLSAGFFGSLFALFKYTIPEANKDIIILLVGSLGTVWVGSMKFFHGTSSSSAKKDIMMNDKKG